MDTPMVASMKQADVGDGRNTLHASSGERKGWRVR
jgi:NAD(P)-dependent dehydrogenase (short-subunit alcohol dehydrogenase family)